MFTRRIVMAAVLLLVLVAGCQRSDPEQAIRDAIDGIELAISERNAGGVSKHLADGFLLDGQLDRDAVYRMMIAQFLRFRNIGTVTSGLVVEIHPNDPGRAFARASVAIAGMQGLIPEDGNLYRINSEWRLEDGAWLLYKLDREH
jgi:hypothetical protein